MWWTHYPILIGLGAVFSFSLLVKMKGEFMILEYEVSDLPIHFMWCVDKISLMFMFMTLCVSTMVFSYMIPYMWSEKNKVGFSKIMLVFLLSMLLLSSSGNLFTMMVGWDGLGVSSFCLIVYYQNWKSFNSGLVTFLTNRLGDACLIISIIMVCLMNEILEIENILLIYIGAMTKSAQFPFSSWLPRAMAAPTPVSALVHSSTLVTAGVFVLSRFYTIFSSDVMQVVRLISVVSIILSTMSALGEYDFKKIIALSTLSHVSLMFLTISIGSLEIGLLHMFLHALFKSTLFIVAGWVIHLNNGEQDIRLLSIWPLHPSVGASLLLSVSSMVGLPFLGGFFSKEEILSYSSMSGDLFNLFTLLFASTLTSSYSVRLLWVLLLGKKVGVLQVISFPPLVAGCLVSGSILSSVFSGMLVSFFLHSSTMYPCSTSVKVLLLIMLSFGVMIGLVSVPFNSVLSGLNSKMWQIESVNEVVVRLVRNLSWNLMFLMGFKGIFDLPFFSKGTTKWIGASINLMFLYPSSVIILLLSSVLVLFGIGW